MKLKRFAQLTTSSFFVVCLCVIIVAVIHHSFRLYRPSFHIYFVECGKCFENCFSKVITMIWTERERVNRRARAKAGDNGCCAMNETEISFVLHSYPTYIPYRMVMCPALGCTFHNFMNYHADLIFVQQLTLLQLISFDFNCHFASAPHFSCIPMLLDGLNAYNEFTKLLTIGLP